MEGGMMEDTATVDIGNGSPFQQDPEQASPPHRRLLGMTIFTVLVLMSGVFYTFFYFRFTWPVAISIKKQLQIYTLPIYTAIALLHILFTLTSGFGLLFYKEWARKLYLAYSVYVLCIGNVFYISFLASPTLRKILLVIMNLPIKTFLAIRDLTIYSSIIPFVPLAIFSLWFLTRPKVKEQFRQGGDANM